MVKMISNKVNIFDFHSSMCWIQNWNLNEKYLYREDISYLNREARVCRFQSKTLITSPASFKSPYTTGIYSAMKGHVLWLQYTPVESTITVESLDDLLLNFKLKNTSIVFITVMK